MKAVYDLDSKARCEDSRLEHRRATPLVVVVILREFSSWKGKAAGVSRLFIFLIQLLGSRTSPNCRKSGNVSQINLLLDWVCSCWKLNEKNFDYAF
ncbi:hypothetical protein AVEN_244454-1 [Araneus ventricosus]|uniref:Uncharacterized protein n=1 Tax=Araneus ventricosus TaxID=182803 RepID=A0A4Y2MZR9_ARAVE|nr:hypothetical protein AVEN_244454-1 [Araneus ventricosus]